MGRHRRRLLRRQQRALRQQALSTQPLPGLRELLGTPEPSFAYWAWASRRLWRHGWWVFVVLLVLLWWWS